MPSLDTRREEFVAPEGTVGRIEAVIAAKGVPGPEEGQFTAFIATPEYGQLHFHKRPFTSIPGSNAFYVVSGGPCCMFTMLDSGDGRLKGANCVDEVMHLLSVAEREIQNQSPAQDPDLRVHSFTFKVRRPRE